MFHLSNMSEGEVPNEVFGEKRIICTMELWKDKSECIMNEAGWADLCEYYDNSNSILFSLHQLHQLLRWLDVLLLITAWKLTRKKGKRSEGWNEMFLLSLCSQYSDSISMMCLYTTFLLLLWWLNIQNIHELTISSHRLTFWQPRSESWKMSKPIILARKLGACVLRRTSSFLMW